MSSLSNDNQVDIIEAFNSNSIYLNDFLNIDRQTDRQADRQTDREF